MKTSILIAFFLCVSYASGSAFASPADYMVSETIHPELPGLVLLVQVDTGCRVVAELHKRIIEPHGLVEKAARYIFGEEVGYTFVALKASCPDGVSRPTRFEGLRSASIGGVIPAGTRIQLYAP